MQRAVRKAFLLCACTIAISSLQCAALQEGVKEHGPEPQLSLENAMGGRLVKECGWVLLSPDVILSPALTFRDQVLLEAGDPKKMSRRQLDSLGADLEMAAFRDLGVVMELNYRPPGDRRSLLPSLLSKWGGLRGENLNGAYYMALVAALEFRAGVAAKKKSADQGFADRLLLEAGPIGSRTRSKMDDLYDDYRDAELRDAGYSLELAREAKEKLPELRASLWEKWSKLRREPLKDEYYLVVATSLTERQKKAELKKPGQRTLSESLLLEANPAAGITRNGVDSLFEVYRIASKCDVARKRSAAKPKQPR